MHSQDNGVGFGPRASDITPPSNSPPYQAPADELLGRTHSGRFFVVTLVFVITALSLALFVAFRQWKGRHQELADYGTGRVAPSITPLGKRVPPEITPARWKLIVDQMRVVLERLTGAGPFELKDLQQLRRDIQLRVDAATPETAAATLASLWSELERRAGPVLARHPVAGMGSCVRDLAKLEPPGINVNQWTLAVLNTRAMLVALASSGKFTKERRRQLKEAIQNRVAVATSESAIAMLHEIWVLAATDQPLPDGFTPIGLDDTVTSK
jgi:hypothetical protein